MSPEFRLEPELRAIAEACDDACAAEMSVMLPFKIFKDSMTLSHCAVDIVVNSERGITALFDNFFVASSVTGSFQSLPPTRTRDFLQKILAT